MAEAPEGAPLALVGVERHYSQGDAKLHILTGADLVLASGEMVALVAPSGAGKSTLLHIAGLLERPDGGDVIVDNLSSAELDDTARTRIRREAIGFVYPSRHEGFGLQACEAMAVGCPSLVARATSRG